ncbi:MAG TPA: polysaccharide deacetylase family protein [Nitrososphaeraceae archaeon]
MIIIKKIITNHINIAGSLIIPLLVLWSLFFAVANTYGLDLSYGRKSSIINDNIGSMSINDNKTIDNEKAVILAFDDAWKSQFTYAKPVLDKYGFKGSFFIVCNYVGKNPDRMTWSDVQTLERHGHDIESHSMNHIPLDDLSQQQLNYEIGQSKQCIIDHSVSPNINNNDVPIFAYPFDIGRNNITVINTVAKYYQLGRTGDRPLAFLNCDLSLEDKNNRSINQTNYLNGNCSRHVFTEIPNNYNNNNNNNYKVVSSTYYDKLLKINKYSISSWTHHPHHLNRLYNSSQMFQQFVQEVISQDKYNHDGIINTIPIITYHNFTNITNMNYVRNKYTTDINLFAREMKFLQDNHFIVLPMSDIRYNENTKYLYVNGPNGK